MATFHVSVKSGGRGKALLHSDYIARVGKHGRKPEAVHLVAQESGNLPPWANQSVRALWQAADQHERKNGAAYRELEIALPRELTSKQNVALVRELAAKIAGAKPYQWALHVPLAALEGAPQPHVHLMLSDRVPDGIERSPETHFRRYNAQDPELGGCRKDSGGRDRATLAQEMVALRGLCAEEINKHLGRHGHEARVDHRSHVARGLTEATGGHLGPARVRAIRKEWENEGMPNHDGI